MRYFIWGVFMYTNLFSSLTYGQHNRTDSRVCGGCQPENCPIPRQCLAGTFPFLSMILNWKVKYIFYEELLLTTAICIDF